MPTQDSHRRRCRAGHPARPRTAGAAVAACRRRRLHDAGAHRDDPQPGLRGGTGGVLPVGDHVGQEPSPRALSSHSSASPRS